MWVVTVCKGDYRMPVRFSTYGCAADYAQSVFTSDDYEDIQVVITYMEECKHGIQTLRD